MEYKLLLLIVLVAMAYAKINKSPRVMNVDTCNRYQEILGAGKLNVTYFRCNEQDEQGNDVCYRAGVACDSIFDCNNMQDEKRPDCPTEHKKYCDVGFNGKPGVTNDCALADWQDPSDRICFGDMDKCDGRRHCPLGDDESNCPS